jgi:hypothetical protein
MRLRRALVAVVFGLALTAAAGPLHFLFFWRKTPVRVGVSKMLRPDQKVELADLLSIAPAKQKCENWAWAAALESVLKAQKVSLEQSYWVMKADGGEVCKESATDLSTLPKLIDGSYILDDGRKVRLVATLFSGAPAEMDAMIVAPRSGRPLLFVWKSHAYLYRGMSYDEMIAPNGQREYAIRQLKLLDPFFEGAEKQIATYDRDKDDPADINGMIDVVVTPIEGPDWLHPEKELEKPSEIYFPKN